jgi:Cys/Met metabolism PLP-dependent enzyme
MVRWCCPSPTADAGAAPILPGTRNPRWPATAGVGAGWARDAYDAMTTFVKSVKLGVIAVRLGNLRTLVYPMPKRDNLIRVSVGCHDTDDLIADFDQALSRVACTQPLEHRGRRLYSSRDHPRVRPTSVEVQVIRGTDLARMHRRLGGDSRGPESRPEGGASA